MLSSTEEELEMDEDQESESQNHNYNLRQRSEGGSGSSGSGSSSVNRVRLNRIPGMPGIIARLIQAVTDNNEANTDDSSEDSDFDPENVEEVEPAFLWPSTRRRTSSLKDKSPPKPKAEWLTKLKNSDFYEETQSGLGSDLSKSNRFPIKNPMLTNVIKNREIGDIHGHRFGHYTLGAKRQVAAHLLPKHAYEQADFDAKVFCGSHSKEGDWFMSACQDQKIRLYNTRKFKKDENNARTVMVLERQIQARNVGWSVLDVALSPDNCHLIYSSWCDSIHQVSLFHDNNETNKHQALPLRADEEHRFCIFSLRFSANGDEILGGANDGYLYVYDRFAQARSLRIGMPFNLYIFTEVKFYLLKKVQLEPFCVFS